MKILPCLAVAAFTVFLMPALADEPTTGGREATEWSDAWFPNSDKADLPRVLLIGDSITRGYGAMVEKNLAGKAYVARIATSQFLSDPLLLGQLRLVLSQMKFDVIHFNNGMHGWTYTEEQYRAGFPAFVAAIRESAPKAKLIWAATTPVTHPGHPEQVDPRAARVKVRNSIAREFVRQAGIPEDDLFSLVEPHPEYQDAGGIHFKPEGYALLARQVAAQIEKLLPAK